MSELLHGFVEADMARIGAVVRAYEAGEFFLGLPKGEEQPGERNYTRIPFRNDSGDTAPGFAVMRVTPPATIDGRSILTIAKPDTSFNRLYLINSRDPVSNGQRGWGTWLWHSDKVLYESGTPAFGESWGPKNGQWSLAKWRYGFTIQGGNDATALTTHAIQHAVNHFWGQTDGAINKGASGTVEVYDGNDAQVTSTTVTGVKNRYANVLDNKKVSVEWLGGSWYLKAAECE